MLEYFQRGWREGQQGRLQLSTLGMGRLQLIEIHEQAWFPKVLRDYTTEALQFIFHIGELYLPIVNRLRKALTKAKAKKVVDLCSGAAGLGLGYFSLSGGRTA
jgi:hypothetical protein